MRKINYSIPLLSGCLALSTSYAGPGYVTRDCVGALTRESITLDWTASTRNSQRFKTTAVIPENCGRGRYCWTSTFHGKGYSLYSFPNPTDSGLGRSSVWTTGAKNHAGFLEIQLCL